MSRSDEYRRFAAACLKIERGADDERQRAIFLQMARTWLALAQKEETKAHRNEGPVEPIN